jgi:hypothetical protein
MSKVLIIFVLLLLLAACNVQPSNDASDITVGNVMILTNGNSYELLRRMAHAFRDGISASGEPVDIDNIANDLVPIYLGDIQWLCNEHNTIINCSGKLEKTANSKCSLIV